MNNSKTPMQALITIAKIINLACFLFCIALYIAYIRLSTNVVLLPVRIIPVISIITNILSFKLISFLFAIITIPINRNSANVFEY